MYWGTTILMHYLEDTRFHDPVDNSIGNWLSKYHLRAQVQCYPVPPGLPSCPSPSLVWVVLLCSELAETPHVLAPRECGPVVLPGPYASPSPVPTSSCSALPTAWLLAPPTLTPWSPSCPRSSASARFESHYHTGWLMMGTPMSLQGKYPHYIAQWRHH